MPGLFSMRCFMLMTPSSFVLQELLESKEPEDRDFFIISLLRLNYLNNFRLPC